MSIVTTVMLNVHPADVTDALEQLQRELKAALGDWNGLGDLVDNDVTLASTPKRWGGNALPGLHLYGAAYNVLNLDRYMEIVLGVPWTRPEADQLFVCEQETFKFTVYEIVDGGWCALRRDRARRLKG